MIKLLIRVFLITLLVFGGLFLLSLFKDEGNIGFPFWFYKDACEMTMNIETGEMVGITYAVSYVNLFLDILISIAVATSILFCMRRKNMKLQNF